MNFFLILFFTYFYIKLVEINHFKVVFFMALKNFVLLFSLVNFVSA